uniref:Uncharacterized protein n=1 Tax=Arundo donax TaxID=35708 RepID=A0A0A9FKB3_ARUDO
MTVGISPLSSALSLQGPLSFVPKNDGKPPRMHHSHLAAINLWHSSYPLVSCEHRSLEVQPRSYDCCYYHH